MFGAGSVFVLCRKGVVCMVNRGENTPISLKAEEFAGDMTADLSGSYTDLLSGEKFTDLTGTLMLPAESAFILIKD